ncbi:hypothetical protein ACJIZ3_003501 [Penstemon smallii]|uniref:Laccase n=1 Tax=Penstemon smallii TaxID=265156 RepID=A0ABD3UC51_9LAMI
MWSITKVFILQIICILLLGGIKSSHAAVRRYTFVLQNSSHTRLCTNKTMLTINGQFPGPTIYARKGDLVIVDVINRAGQNITIHWHGVKMSRYPWSDGPEFVTQCPISPGTRDFDTLWWHAHSEWSRASVYDALIILPERNQPYPFPKPHAEVPILLGEWWNSDVQEVMEEFLANRGDPNVFDDFLINGQPGDLYSCSRQDTFRLTVEFGRTYLIRMVNAVMNNIMFFRIANHNITIIGSDATYTKQFSSDYITISPGQTIDFLLEANQPPSHYYMDSRAYASTGNFDNTTTTRILQYSRNYTIPSSPPLPTFPEFNDTSASVNYTTRLRSLANKKYPIDVPLNFTDILFFTLSINVRPCPLNAPSSVNNVTMVLPRTDILQAYYRNISGVYENDFPDNPPFHLITRKDGTAVNILDYNATMELVFQGTNTVAGVDHPMHLHGYSFYVVGFGLGNFGRVRDPPQYNLVDPPLMETIAVPVNGWTSIRFQANNPGVWFMHCHFERHVSWGMGMVFIVRNGRGPTTRMLPPPPDMPRC